MSVLQVDIVLYFCKMFYLQAHIGFETKSVLGQEFPGAMLNSVKTEKLSWMQTEYE